jgi:pentatricopeptide repeat protein
LHVLNLSARIGDVKLATDVFRVFAERDTILTSYHYEMLLEAYLNSNDLSAAISVIHIMTEAGIKIDESSVHPLYCFLKQDEARPMEAFNILQTAEASGRKIPTASVNACIQASIHFNKLEEAIEIYKALHTVSRAGPSTQTFNILFQGCHKAGRKELAMFLASEMTKLGLEPDMLTYDRLILVCCNASDPEDAFLYYEEMRRSEFVPRRGTFDALIELGVVQGDPRTPKVLEDMRNCGYRPSRSTEASVHEMFSGEAREQTEGSGSVGGIST